MTTYMVFEPPERGDDPATHAERMVFIRDRFSWGAFLVPPLWMLWRRLWLVFLIYLVGLGAVMTAAWAAGVSPGGRNLIYFLVVLLIGFEAGNLRRWKLLRGGWRERGTVIGSDIDTAERRFFDAYVADAAERPDPVAAGPAPAFQPWNAGSDVIGLFPQPGAAR